MKVEPRCDVLSRMSLFVFLAFTVLCPCFQNRVNTFVNNISKENIMINITFPDGAVREFESGVTTFEIAQSISNSLAKKAGW